MDKLPFDMGVKIMTTVKCLVVQNSNRDLVAKNLEGVLCSFHSST